MIVGVQCNRAELEWLRVCCGAVNAKGVPLQIDQIRAVCVLCVNVDWGANINRVG